MNSESPFLVIATGVRALGGSRIEVTKGRKLEGQAAKAAGTVVIVIGALLIVFGFALPMLYR